MESTSSKSAILANATVFARLKEIVIKETGLAYYQRKDDDLAERLSRRLEALNLDSSIDYLQLLLQSSGRAELDLLIGELTIGETYFFRHKEQFDVLKVIVLPDLIKKNVARKSLRIWSAGASIGAEAYSVAILLKQDFSSELAGWNIEIVGTDINRSYLATATAGSYQAWALRSLADAMKLSCFDAAQDGTNAWRLKDDYKKNVRFLYHNLCTSPFPSYESGLAAFDVILCRNVMIYFDQTTVQRLLNQFSQSLTEGGWLLTGSSEINVTELPGLRLHQYTGASAYQKTNEPMSLPNPALSAFAWRAPLLTIPEPKTKTSPPPSAVLPLRRSEIVKAQPDIAEELRTVRELADRGDLNNAIKRCESLLAVAPVEARAHFLHALICIQLGQDTRSEESLRRVIYLDRKFVLAHYHLGLLLKRKGNAAKGEQFLDNAWRLLSELPPMQPLEEGQGMSVQDLLAVLNTLGARAS